MSAHRIVVTAYCPSCRQHVVPLDDGRCTWCSAQTGGAVIRQRPSRPDLVAPHLAGPRPQKITAGVLAKARRLYASGLSFRNVAAEIIDRTEYVSVASCAQGLCDQFKLRGWPARDRVQAAVAASFKHGRATGERVGYKAWLRTARGDRQPQCAGVKTTYPSKGRRCACPAIRGSEFCRVHDPAHREQVLLDLEDARARQRMAA